jgi:RHS repeat-associated protein
MSGILIFFHITMGEWIERVGSCDSWFRRLVGGSTHRGGAQHRTRAAVGRPLLGNTNEGCNNTTGWYETLFRDYDPAIGRFTSIDPLATKFSSLSGYHYSYNNPVQFSDPLGAYPDSRRDSRTGAQQIPPHPVGWAPGGNSYGDDYGYYGGGGYGYGSYGPDAFQTGAAYAPGYNWRSDAPEAYLQMINTLNMLDQEHEINRFIGEHTRFRMTETRGFLTDGRSSAKGVRYVVKNGSWRGQQNDRSRNFYLIDEKNEFWAYKQMLSDQKFSGKEISAYLVERKDNKKRGILIQPWAKNSKDEADPYVGLGFEKNTITLYGVEYTPLLWIHTHPGNDNHPSGKRGDQGVLLALRELGLTGINGGILTDDYYTPFDTSANHMSYTPGSNTNLLTGKTSLFPK